jgi:hypothetical protein
MQHKKTKFWITFVAVALVVSGITSCKKYLNVTPVSSFGTDYVFSNYTNANLAVLGTYAALGGDQGYGIRISMYYPYDNDEMMGQGGAPGDNERRDIARYNAQPSNTQLANPFNQLYSGIERANICIYNIPKMDAYTNGSEFDQKRLRQLHGEVLALRAQYYYELIRNWGDVPAQFQPSSLETDLFKSKTDRDSIYTVILADLVEAESLIPWRSQAGVTSERITKGAVKALRARIALAKGGYSLRRNKQMERPANYKEYYEIARAECLAIMQSGEHNLNPSYRAVWKDAIGAHKQEPNGEILWEVGGSGGGSGFGDTKLGYYNGPRYNGTGNSALTILPTFFYSFDTADTRRDVTTAPYDLQQNLNVTGRTLVTMVDGKYRRDWTSQVTTAAQYLGTNWVMIRYSDVLLMFAEAENEINNGPTAAAKQALEKVRLRAFAGNASKVGTIPSDYAGFFNAIMDERRWELGGEGIRKYDLIRWNRLKTNMDIAKAQMADMVAKNPPYAELPATMYYYTDRPALTWANSLYEPAPSTAPAGTASVAWVSNTITTSLINIIAQAFTPNKSELLPLPQASIDANPNLKQDYGY